VIVSSTALVIKERGYFSRKKEENFLIFLLYLPFSTITTIITISLSDHCSTLGVEEDECSSRACNIKTFLVFIYFLGCWIEEESLWVVCFFDT